MRTICTLFDAETFTLIRVLDREAGELPILVQFNRNGRMTFGAYADMATAQDRIREKYPDAVRVV